jgi:uncharacterized repeat protein (TIGR01451 family)
MTNRWLGWWKQALQAARRGRKRPFAWDWAGLWLERLEDRSVPAVYRVTGTADGLGVVTPSATPGVDFDASTLRAAVIAANASTGVADTIQLPAGTYTLTLTGTTEDTATSGDLDITDNLTIVGAGTATTAVDGNLTDRVFKVFSGTTLNLSNMTIQNGRAQPGDSPPGTGANDAFGGGILNLGSLVLDTCVVTGNQANGADGTFNAGQGRGGGIYQDGSSLTLRNTTVTNNQAAAGNAKAPTGTFAFGANGEGGGIFNNSGTVDIENSVLSNNLAQGGAATSDYGGFGGNGDGGGLATVLGSVTIQNTTLNNNQAAGGTGSTGLFGGINGTGSGGGINDAAPIQINAAPTLVINSTTLNNNSADDGGGIFNISTETLTNSTLSGNQARNNGGGINETSSQTTNLNNVTVTANVADSDADGGGDGGGVFNDFGSVHAQSTIIAGNFDNSPGPKATINPDISGTFVSGGHNLIGDSTGGTGFTDGVMSDQVGSSTATLNPLLGPLANNGGPTFTHALLAGSPAIDQGANPLNLANDQRGPGFARTVGAGTDIGAFEAQAPDLTITKDDGLTTVTPGQTVTYTLTIKNVGEQTATGVVLTDTLPANTTFVSASNGGTLTAGVVLWSVGSVTVGPSVTRTVVVQVNNPVPAGVTTIINTATVADDGTHGTDPTPGNNTASDTDTVNAVPDLTITKDDGLTSVVPGQTVTYTLTISNVGNKNATGVVATDTLPANTTFVSASNGGTLTNGVVTWNVGPLGGGGGNVTRTVTVQVNNPVPAGVNTIVNTATVADDGTNGADPTPGNNTASDTDILNATPDLTITKDDGLTTVTPGQTVTYTLTISNVGNQGGTGVVATDTLPANTTFVSASNGGTLTNGVVTWNIGPLAAGAGSVTRTVTVQVNNPVPAGVTTITNTATVADDGTNGPDPTPGNNTASDTDTVNAVPDLTITKDDSLTTVVPGQTVTYTLTINNVGNKNATGVVATDTLPANTTFVSASNGGTLANGVVTWNIGAVAGAGGQLVTRTVTVRVNSSVPAGVETIVNTATVADDGTNGADPTPGDNTASDTDTLNATPNLTIAKDDGLTTVRPGQTITYTLTMSNIGNQGATGVVTTDTLPTGTTFVSASNSGTLQNGVVTWMIGSLASGGTVTRTVTVTVNNPAPAGLHTIVNTANVADDGTNGPDPSQATDIDTLLAVPDLTITKDDGLTTVVPGQTVTYTLTIRNVGNQDATGVVTRDTLPVNTMFVSASSGGTLANGVVTWNIGPLGGGGGSATRTLTVQVNNAVTPGVTTVTNTATVADDGTNGADPTPNDNTATDTDLLPITTSGGFAQATVGTPPTPTPATVMPTLVSKVSLLGSNIGVDLTGNLAGPTAYVNSLYHLLLNRAPAVAEVNHWVFML